MTNVNLTFDDLDAGTFVDNEYQADGVTISSIVGGVVNGHDSPAMVFDTNNPTGGDHDLATSNLDNVLIISEDGDSNDPDDEACGGVLRFDFEAPSTMNELTLLDVEECARIKLYDEHGNVIYDCTYQTANNGQKVVDFGAIDGVVRMDVIFYGSGALDNVNFDSPVSPDGTVEGTAGDDVIDVAYTGDPEGDMVDAGDAILPGAAPDDDLIEAYGGNDTVLAGKGDDEVYGGSGDDHITGGSGGDTVYGEAGNDTIIGDGTDGGAAGGMDGKVLIWDEVAADGTQLGGVTNHDVGGINVAIGFTSQDHGATGTISNATVYAEGGEGFGSNSSLELWGQGGEGGWDDTSTTELTFSSTSGDYQDEVQDVAFRINDVDLSTDFGDTHIDRVTIRAYDAEGNLIDVDITSETGDQVINGNQATGDIEHDAGVNPNTEAGSILVNIAGPVARIEIDYDNGGETTQGVWVSDVTFTTIPTEPVDGPAGDDLLYGGDGVDYIEGNGGDDTIYGGAEGDTIDGGDGDDFLVGDGDGADYFPEQSKDISNVVFYFDRDGDGEYDYSVKVDEFPDSGESGFISNDLDDYYGQMLDYIYEQSPELVGMPVVAGVSTKAGTEENFYAVDGDTNGPLPDDGPTINTGPGNDEVLLYDDFYGTYDPTLTPTGNGGPDSIIGGDGSDVVYGGVGGDTIDTSGDDEPLPDVGYPGVYPADSDPNNDKDLVFGEQGDDIITTGDDDDEIYGGSGNDTIDAGIDDDYVEGGTGDDTIIGSEGNDELYGQDGNDTIYGGLVTPGPADALNLPDDLDGDGDSNDLGEDLVTFNNNDTVYGGAGDDTLYGADDDDTLYGGTGNDFLDGGVDDDEMYGDEGEDTLIGGQGEDDLYGGLGDDLFLGGNGGDNVVGGEDPDLDGDGQSDDWDVLDLTGSNVDYIDYVPGDPEAGTVYFLDGSTMTFSEIENVIPCFTPGTTIATPKGERLVEELREGDRIITRDNGIQEIRWVGRKDMAGTQLVKNPHLKPILIKAGALGNGLPERDMVVSPNHRVLVASDLTQLYFEEREVLAAAKHLVGSDGVHELDVMQTSYIHFMFDRHEVVLSNGCWTESFQPGDYSLKGIGNSQRNEIFELFPELATKPGLEGYQAARRALKKHEAKLLVK